MIIMPDDRQHLINEAAQKLRDAGCSVVSIMAEWPDKEHRSAILIMGDKNMDPWKDKRPARTQVKRGLGRGLEYIQRSRHSDEELNRLIDVVKKA